MIFKHSWAWILYLLLSSFPFVLFHLKQYKRVSRRNTFTVTYRLDERHSLEYGQIEIFFKAPVGSRTSCGAVFKPLSRTSKGICEQHKVLKRPVNHIIALHHPHRYLMFPLKTLLISVFIWHFLDSEVHYAAHFSNHLEQDSDSKLLVNVTAVCWQGNGNAHDTCIE